MSVNVTLRVVRKKSWAWIRFSNRAIDRLMWDVDSPNACAPPAKLPAASTATNSSMPSHRVTSLSLFSSNELHSGLFIAHWGVE